MFVVTGRVSRGTSQVLGQWVSVRDLACVVFFLHFLSALPTSEICVRALKSGDSHNLYGKTNSPKFCENLGVQGRLYGVAKAMLCNHMWSTDWV